MKIIRSSSVYFKHLTEKKKSELSEIRKEYHAIVQHFIDKYQDQIPDKPKNEFRLKGYVKTIQTWLSARMIQNAIGEGWDLVSATRKSCKEREKPYTGTKHNIEKMVFSSQICSICLNPKTSSFDLNVTLGSIGNNKKISIPLHKHRQFNKWFTEGKLCSSVTLFPDHVQFSFKIETGEKKKTGTYLGIDIGANVLLACSDGKRYGTKLRELIDKLRRHKRCSKGWYKCKTEIREYIDITINELPWNILQLIVCENLKGLKNKMKVRRRLTRNIRRVISNWNYRYVLMRLQQRCEENRVSFRTVSPYNTSITCSCCGYADKGNRLSQESFCCLKCGHSDNADINASKVILDRFLTGKYGACFKGNRS